MPAGSGVFEFGPYQLNADRRQLTRDGQLLPLPPKTFELLLLLIGSDGSAIAKDHLLDALWPGTTVQEASLTFQISTLRKALGEPAAAWIESVPRFGYRFAGPIVPRQLSLPSRPHAWLPWLFGAALLVAILILLMISLKPKPDQTLITAIPVTAYPGMEIQPSLSPDGSQVAFSWNGSNEDNFDIYVKLTGPGEPVRLTSDPAVDFSPRWSPDGKSIAFLRGRPASRTVTVFVMPVLGGAARKVTDVYQPLAELPTRVSVPNANLAWTPDSLQLVVTGKSEPVGTGQAEIAETRLPLLLADVETGKTRTLTEPPVNWLGDFGPAFSLDGRQLAFVRARALTVTELWVLPLNKEFLPAGAPRKVTAASSIGEPQWIPGSHDLLFSSGQGMAPRRLLRVSSTNESATHREVPVGEEATAHSISKNSKLIYSRRLHDANIYTWDARQGAATRVINSTLDDREPDYSPDGARIVFASTRSGTDEIWMSNVDGSNPVKLTNMHGPLIANPQWSPAGRDVLFDSRISDGGGLHLVDTVTLQVRRIWSSGVQPRWSHDGRWIYFAVKSDVGSEVWKIQPDKGNPVQVTRSGGLSGQESPDGKYFYFSRGSPSGLWRMPLGGGPEEKITGDLCFPTSFDATNEGVYFLTRHGQPQLATLRFFDSHSKQTTKLFETGKPWSFGISVAPNGHQVSYAVVDALGSDLLFADRFR